MILRPSREVAVEQIGLLSDIWGEEIVVSDVPIRRSQWPQPARMSPGAPLRSQTVEWLIAQLTALHGHVDPQLAATELAKRMTIGRCTPDEASKMIECALRYQADRSRTWYTDVGDILDAAHKRGILRPDDWRRYALQSVGWKLQIPNQIRSSEVMDVIVIGLPVRLGRNTVFAYEYADQGMLLSGKPIHAGAGAGSKFRLNSDCRDSGRMQTCAGQEPQFNGLRGTQTLTYVMRVSFSEPSARYPLGEPGAFIGTGKCPVSRQFVIIP